jgi:hypothetical protein
MRCCRILVSCVLAALLWPDSAARPCPTEPTDSWVYPYLYELRLREPTEPLFVSTGPYGRLETAEWLQGAGPMEAGTRGAWLYEMLEAEFAPETRILGTGSGWTSDLQVEAQAETDSRSPGEALGRFSYYSPVGLCFWTSLRASVNGRHLHKVQTQEWKDRARASVDYAGVAFHKSGFFISLARDEVSWGADRRAGLLFSGTAPVFDMLSIGYRARRVAFTSFHSRLRRGLDEGSDDGLRRFVAAHRLEFLPTDLISFSVSEAVLYGGPYRTFEPVYLNPLTVFYADQWNSGWNDNILIAGDFSLLFPRRAEIRGELVIDDFQYDFGTEPHEFGAGIFVNAINPFYSPASLVGASYYHIRNQTYGHFVEWNRFIQEGQVMGYPDGPDGDRFASWLTLALPEGMVWRADYSLTRKGEGRATDVQEAIGPRVAFPSGTVETSHLAGLAVEWRPSHAWLVSTGLSYHHIRNVGNREGVDRSGWNLSLGARLDLRIDTLLGH